MSSIEYSKEDILERVEIEGFEYAFLDYFSVENLKDYSELQKLVETFQKTRDKIEKILEEWEEEIDFKKEEENDD